MNIKLIIGNSKKYNKNKILSEKYKKKFIGPNDFFLSAYSSNKLIGSLRIKCIDNVYVIRDLYILPDYRGQGIGKKIMIYILDFLKPKHKKIVLYVDPNNIVAISLYTKLGFKLVNKNDKYGDIYEYI